MKKLITTLGLGIALSTTTVLAQSPADADADFKAKYYELLKKQGAEAPSADTGFEKEEKNFLNDTAKNEYRKKKFIEVRNHVLRGASYCKKVGTKVCVEEFNKKKSKWVNGWIYFWVNDFNGVVTAHPKLPFKGLNKWDLQDKVGNFVYQKLIKKVQEDGYGWVDYVWEHPLTGKKAEKTSFVIAIGDNQLMGAGIYK